jgi:hypothetical protein
LHTLAWWVALMIAVAALLRRLLAPGVAMLALALYAIDDAHTLPVSWIANRSEIVSIAFAIGGLYAHVLARVRASRALRIASWLLVSLALLAGEHAFAPLAYFVAIELCDGEAPRSARVRRVLPFLALAGAYMIARGALGYGVKGTSFYVDPIADPARYLAACASRLPLLVGDLVTGYAAEWHRWPPPWRPQWLAWHVLPASWLSVEALLRWQRWTGVASVLLVIAACVSLRRTKQQRQLRWLLVGATLSLIPVCGTVANSRLTISAAIGFNAALAYALVVLAARFRSAPRAHAVARALVLALVAGLVLGAHVAYAAARTYGETAYYAIRARDEEAWAMHAELGTSDVRGKHVIVIAAPDWLTQFGLPYAWALSRRPLPASTELLSAESESPHRFTRMAPDVLDLELPETPSLGFRASVYRREDAGFARGDTLHAHRFTVQTLAAHGGEPTRLRFTFHEDLDSGAYIFLYPRFDGLKPVAMPALGETLQLPPPAWPVFVR